MSKINTVMRISFPFLFISIYSTLSTSAEIYPTEHLVALLSTITFGTILLISVFYKILQNAKKKKILSIFQIDLNSN
jgi:hypothetical protein